MSASDEGRPNFAERAEASFKFFILQWSKFFVALACILFSLVVHFLLSENASFVVKPWIVLVYVAFFVCNLVLTYHWWSCNKKDRLWLQLLRLENLVYLTIFGISWFDSVGTLVLWSILLPVFLLIVSLIGYSEYRFNNKMWKTLQDR
jgi:hypothetical protein